MHATVNGRRWGARGWAVGVAAALVAVLALGALVAALGSGADGGRSSGDSGDAARAGAVRGREPGGFAATAPPAAVDEATEPAGGGAGPGSLGGLVAPGGPTRVVKTATVSLRVERGRLDPSYSTVLRTVTAAGGFVVDTSEDPGRRASLTLRVPATQFERVLAAIRGVGKVTDESVQGHDVSAEFVDLEARLRNWRAQEAVLLDLMRQARTIADTITVQQQLSQIQQQIEELEGRRRLLEDQSAFGTVTVALAVPGAAAAAPVEQSTLAAAWEDAVGVALAVLGGTLVVLGALLPLGLIVALGLAVWVLVRRRRLPGERDPSVA